MKGWRSLTLGEVVRLEYGKPLAPEDRNPTGLYPAYGANGEKDRTDRFYRDQPSIIVGRKGSAGEITLTEEKYWPLDVTYFAEFDRQLYDLRFLYYLLSTLDLPSLAKGVKPGINRNEVFAIPVRVPPLPEQRRIVAILDEAFEAIATAEANAEKNLRNAHRLFASSLAKIFSADWPRVRIEEACQSIMDCVNKTAPTVSEATPYKMIRTTNVRNGAISLASVNYASEDIYKTWTRRQVPRRGDVVLTREAPMGEVGMLETDELVFLGQRLVSYRAEPTKLDGKFLLYALQSEPLQRQIHALASGSTVQHMRVPDSKRLQLPLPTLQEQRAAVALLDALREETTGLRAVYSRKLDALDELKNSLLHQAFTGQLTSKQTRAAQQPALPTTTPEFIANVIAFAHAQHARQKRDRTFGRVKAQKVLHLVESIAKIDLGRRPLKDAAGPNDFQHMLKAEEWAKTNRFFEMVKRGEGYEFKKLSGFDEHLTNARRALAPWLPQLEHVIDLLMPMDTEEAEVFATVHAAWNNLLIDGAEVTDETIVFAAREGWHADKRKIPADKFRSAIALIRKKGLVPDGTAKYVGGQQSLL